MASFVVMEPPARGADKAVLVRDGFHVLAFILPVVWLLLNRLWIEALAVLVLGAILGGIGTYLGIGPAASVASLMLAIFMGLEASSLKIAALRRRGWREWGVVEADNAADGEIRYLSELVEAEPVQVAAPVMPVFGHPQRNDPRHNAPALGMLGYPVKG